MNKTLIVFLILLISEYSYSQERETTGNNNGDSTNTRGSRYVKTPDPGGRSTNIPLWLTPTDLGTSMIWQRTGLSMLSIYPPELHTINNSFMIFMNDDIPTRRGINIPNDPSGEFNFWIHSWQNEAAFNFKNALNENTYLTIKKNGKVGIGTNTPTGTLTVNGNIISEEMEVVVDVWPDYVFNDNYKLISLTRVESFIKKNKHLPDVPSEREVKENGLNLGDMDAILLKKIEELTLYIIEQDKRMRILNEKIGKMEVLIQESDSLYGEKVPCEKIEIGCLVFEKNILGQHVITNNEDYRQILEPRSPHPDCGSYQLPDIDFNQYTLIGYISSVAGCDFPKISYEAIRNNNQYSINIEIIQRGFCMRNNPVKVWCLIPKIDENSDVNFNIEITKHAN